MRSLAGVVLAAAGAHAAAQARCGDANGAFCGAGEDCCFAPAAAAWGPEAAVLPAHLPTLEACCPAGRQCVRDCAAPAAAFECLPRGSHVDNAACGGDMMCCGPQCCETCCGEMCLPRGGTCCPVSAPPPLPQAAPRVCPAEAPTCCGDSLCCGAVSDCCEGCAARGEGFACCGGCTCCDLTQAFCAPEGAACVPISNLWLRQLLLAVWVAVAAAVAAFTVRGFLAPPAPTPRLNYTEILDGNSGRARCASCGHACHKGRCNDGGMNTSHDCITCQEGCRRRGCHSGSGKDRRCLKAFTVDEKTSRSKATPSPFPLTPLTRGSSSPPLQYETVSIKVVNATCPCTGCSCASCLPFVKCACRQCTCKGCRSVFSTVPAWGYAHAAAAALLLLASLAVNRYLADALSSQLATVAALYAMATALAVAAATFHAQCSWGLWRASAA
eukprot:TRINITY_DN10271_c0_g1_i1.p1 TRINITY_DN10271_c0_g1~~TRINITY_DN10271_c0_g1_i1.p1  ORF type:complete len:442 (+),score=107.71 TRINITY_DN10271_c0_g1_i1:69-1394(+)